MKRNYYGALGYAANVAVFALEGYTTWFLLFFVGETGRMPYAFRLLGLQGFEEGLWYKRLFRKEVVERVDPKP